ncbi:Helicase-like transcription factor [Emericellopsis cladophorae]|uniref:Helicase-like transcription factor n=1 Tax=Emericellopsis cladophorae TaxID=2686198 RepID=A0A9Q0BGK3_9HYPO|nr:Helicase-like transcription factor [Emericellopsis cladophorae]KAI6785117.1 Helicase-like transcription factor [Emericellopsis cladophorae]
MATNGQPKPPSWNPAALLQPNRNLAASSQQGTPSDLSTVQAGSAWLTQQANANGPQLFKFENPNETTSGASTPSYSSESASAHPTTFAGPGNWIEKVHNVQDRSEVSEAKRRKVDSEDSPGRSKIAMRNASGSGALGQALKDANADSNAAALPQTATVDLTNEVITIGDPGDDEVCYGLLKCTLNCTVAPSSKFGAQSTWGPNYQPVIKVVLKRVMADKTTRIQVYDYTRVTIGHVDPKSASALSPLLDANIHLRTECRLPPQPKAPGSEPGKPVSHAFKLDVTLYGKIKYAKSVGGWLEKQEQRLNAPTMGLWFMQAREEPYYSSSVRAVQGDHRDHDKWLKDRENMIPSLWKKDHTASGEMRYFNIITQTEQRQPPPETLGGILADVMGLGKTLSILSLISSSFPAAEQWAATPVSQLAPADSKANKQDAVTSKPSLDLVKLTVNAKTTLLICPLSTITNWEEQIKQHTKENSISYYIYHGANRIRDVKKLVQIVLDEAHMIREKNTLNFKSAVRLHAQRRWAVTGTPVQNRLDDLGSLLAFVRLHPFEHRLKFNRYILEPFKAADKEVVPRLRALVDTVTIRRLKDKVPLPPRTDLIVRLDFSPDEKKLHDTFKSYAKKRVDALTSEAGVAGGTKLPQNTYIHVLKSILMMRLVCAHGKDLLNESDFRRVQGVSADTAINLDDEPDIDAATLQLKQQHDNFALLQQSNGDSCMVCQKKIGASDEDEVDDDGLDDIMGYMTTCLHVICANCAGDYVPRFKAHVQRSRGSCLTCYAPTSPELVPLPRSLVEAEHTGDASSDERQEVEAFKNYLGPHTKSKALVEDLLKSKAHSEAHPEEAPLKSVVFSGWTRHLDLIEMALKPAGIKFVRLDGRMTRPARSAAIKQFREDDSVHVIIISISAGGLGLNLVTGNTAYVMEPQFNPAAEAQAIDRVHRLGQKRPVRTVKYIMNHSFEEDMLALQDKKKQLASLAVDRKDKSEAQKTRLEDLKILFK